MIPADVRNLVIRRHYAFHGDHPARTQSQSRMNAVFFAFLKQKLHAQTDAHQGFAAAGLRNDHLIQTVFPQLIRRITERAHAGQKDFVGGAEDCRVTGDGDICADGFQRTLEGKEVSHAVIYDGNHVTAPPLWMESGRPEKGLWTPPASWCGQRP